MVVNPIKHLPCLNYLYQNTYHPRIYLLLAILTMEDALISSMLRIEYVFSEASLLNCISSEMTNYHYPMINHMP